MSSIESLEAKDVGEREELKRILGKFNIKSVISFDDVMEKFIRKQK